MALEQEITKFFEKQMAKVAEYSKDHRGPYTVDQLMQVIGQKTVRKPKPTTDKPAPPNDERCIHVFSRGARKDERCDKLKKAGTDYCSAHIPKAKKAASSGSSPSSGKSKSKEIRGVDIVDTELKMHTDSGIIYFEDRDEESGELRSRIALFEKKGSDYEYLDESRFQEAGEIGFLDYATVLRDSPEEAEAHKETMDAMLESLRKLAE